jgi:hypothetical protein
MDRRLADRADKMRRRDQAEDRAGENEIDFSSHLPPHHTWYLELQISRSQARVPGDAGQHAWAEFVSVVKREYVIRPTDSFQDAVRSA